MPATNDDLEVEFGALRQKGGDRTDSENERFELLALYRGFVSHVMTITDLKPVHEKPLTIVEHTLSQLRPVNDLLLELRLAIAKLNIATADLTQFERRIVAPLQDRILRPFSDQEFEDGEGI